jgi:ankyrin repeat protein
VQQPHPQYPQAPFGQSYAPQQVAWSSPAASSSPAQHPQHPQAPYRQPQSSAPQQPASTPDNERKLRKAAEDNDKTTAVALLKAGTNVNCRDGDKWAPLHDAARNNSLEVAQVLLAHGADVNARGSHDSAPLHNAAHHNSLEVAQVLLAHGADVNARDKNEWAPLHDAAQNNSLEVAQVLLAHGADVNARDIYYDGATPVAWAMSEGHREMEALLRQHGGH